jgi:hypothetical protein
MYYVAHTVDMVRDAAGQDPSELMSKDDEVKRHFDQLLAQASPSVIADVEKAIAGIMPVINQARQMLQSMQPQPQADPAVVLATQASMAETQRKTAADQASAQQAEADRQANLLIQQERNAIQSQRNENQLDIADQANATREAIANYDGQTARDIASARLTEGVRTGYTNGESIKSGV